MYVYVCICVYIHSCIVDVRIRDYPPFVTAEVNTTSPCGKPFCNAKNRGVENFERMYICVCVCVYIYICMYVCMCIYYVCIRVCVCVYVCLSLCVYINICIYIYCVCVCVCIYICMCTCNVHGQTQWALIHTYIDRYGGDDECDAGKNCTYIHTYIHTYTQVNIHTHK